jgi:hypothetical protein
MVMMVVVLTLMVFLTPLTFECFCDGDGSKFVGWPLVH